MHMTPYEMTDGTRYYTVTEAEAEFDAYDEEIDDLKEKISEFKEKAEESKLLVTALTDRIKELVAENKVLKDSVAEFQSAK